MTPEREIMRTIVDWPDYKVTTLGRVWSGRSKKFLKPLMINGYAAVKLYRLGKSKVITISTLVLEAFVGPRPARHKCRRLNGDINDNRLANLEWRQCEDTNYVTSPEDRDAAYDAFKYAMGKPGGITKQWPPKTIRRCFKSVKSTEQAKRLIREFRAEFEGE